MSEELYVLPTGKSHVSFSEIKEWAECSWRHKLAKIDKIDMFKPSPYLGFGTAVHEGCENMLEGKDLNKDKLLNDIREDFKKHGFDDPEWVDKQPGWYKKSSDVGVEKWCTWAENMWAEVPDYLDKEFPGWETVKAEEYLYETIEGKPVKFKAKDTSTGFLTGKQLEHMDGAGTRNRTSLYKHS